MAGTPLLQRAAMKRFIAAIFVLGVIRFLLTVTGVPDAIVKFSSMTVAIAAGTIYFALTTDTHKERLRASFLLLIPYMIIEIAALGYSWVSGHQNIFHSHDYSFGMPISYHTLGHLVGGVTWEPLAVFLLMEIIWGISVLFRRK
jgi:hypothetical protein